MTTRASCSSRVVSSTASWTCRSTACPNCKRDPNLKVYQFPSTYTRYILLNVQEAPLDDVHARRALQYATDRQTLVDVVLFGAGIPATSFMPKGALYWNDTLEGYPYDLAKAQEELAQSATPEGFALELSTHRRFRQRRNRCRPRSRTCGARSASR